MSSPRDSAAAQPRQWPFPPLPPGVAPTLPVVELVNRALQDSNHSLDGREVTISGIIIRPKDLEQQHPGTRSEAFPPRSSGTSAVRGRGRCARIPAPRK